MALDTVLAELPEETAAPEVEAPAAAPSPEQQLEQAATADFDRILASVPGANTLNPIPPAISASRADYIAWYAQQPQPIDAATQANMDSIIGRQIAAAMPIAPQPAAEPASPNPEQPLTAPPPATDSAPEPEATPQPEAPPQAEQEETGETEPLSEERLAEIATFAERLKHFKSFNLARPNYYDLLGISAEETDVEKIKAAYRATLSDIHPDAVRTFTDKDKILEIEQHAQQVTDYLSERGLAEVTIDDLRRAEELVTPVSQAVNQAYEVISSPESKEIYDWFLLYGYISMVEEGERYTTVLKTYFRLNTDQERRKYIQQWDARFNEIHNYDKNKQEEEDRRFWARAEQRQKEWEEQQKREKASADVAERIVEVEREREASYQKNSVRYEDLGWLVNDPSSLMEFLLSKAQRPESPFTVGSMGQLQEDPAVFFQRARAAYRGPGSDEAPIRAAFADGSQQDFQPRNLLQELLYAAWAAEAGFNLSALEAVELMFTNQGDRQSLTELQTTVEQVVRSLQSQGASPELVRELRALNATINQVKTILDLSQLLGAPVPLGRIVEFCSQRLKSSKLTAKLVIAAVNEVFSGRTLVTI